VAVDHPVWTGTEWITLPVPDLDGEALVLPLVSALVYDGLDRRRILLQRRDRPGEAVRGRLELPGGRWSAGERPDVAVAREVLEETGVRLTAVAAGIEITRHEANVAMATARPLAVVNGIDGAFPGLHVLFECYGEGEPRPVPDEVADPRWWPVADVRRHLADHPEDFVWHTRALLAAADLT
jgi:8-oxo-dGTP pyrophosphatase MutT (NUDIX family)